MDFGYVRVSTKEQNPDRQTKVVRAWNRSAKYLCGEEIRTYVLQRSI